jgi:hypothetical protein
VPGLTILTYHVTFNLLPCQAWLSYSQAGAVLQLPTRWCRRGFPCITSGGPPKVPAVPGLVAAALL